MIQINNFPKAHFPITLPTVILTPLDLSENNKDLLQLHAAADYENYIKQLLQSNKATIAYGGYLEQRNLYKRSTIFNDENIEERNIHLGVDYWCAANTPVIAAFDGVVHSFANNVGLGNYGPTIILQHQFMGNIFHTLYGHLSNESLTDKFICKAISAGQSIGTLGTAAVNGDYAPHLHFQIIIDMQTNTGDYPGVCAKKDLDYYKVNCPNPSILFSANK